MSHRVTPFLLMAVTLVACTRELPTNPKVGLKPLFAKPGSGTLISLADGFVATSVRVNNESQDPSRLRLRENGGYTASINLDETHGSAPAACKTVGDAAVALGLVPFLIDALRDRTVFAGDVNLATLGTADSYNEVAVFWVDGDRSYYLTIGQTNPSDATFPGVFPSVIRNGSVYSFSGGILTLRVNYLEAKGNRPRNASLVCPNSDVVEMIYSAS